MRRSWLVTSAMVSVAVEKAGGEFFPAHGECDGDGNQGGFVGAAGEEDSELDGIIHREEETVETIGQIGLGKMDGAIARVGSDEGAEQTVQGAAELHGFDRSVGLGGAVDAKESAVHDGARASVALGDNSNGAEAEVGVVLHEVKGEDHPETLVDHVGHVFAKKVGEFVGGFVGAAIDSCLEFGGGPGWIR